MTRSTIVGAVLTLSALVAISAPAQAGGVAAGDVVVAEWEVGAFFTGTVKSLDATSVVVAWTDGSDPSAVPTAKVFAIPKKAKRKLKARTLGLCAYGSESKWYDCKITKVKPTSVLVTYSDGDHGELGFDGIIVPVGQAAKELAARAKGGGGGGGGGGSGDKPAGDDGFNPTLQNNDDDDYTYELECGGSTTTSSIYHSTTITLSKGCTLRVAGGTKSLRGNMSCQIKGGSLSCN